MNDSALFKEFAEPHREALLDYLNHSSYNAEWFPEYVAKLEPQPFIDVNSHRELPKIIERKCCMFKSCGNSRLYLAFDAEIVNEDTLETVVSFSYKRSTNDEPYFSAGTLEELVAKLNDPLHFPERENSND